MSDAILKAVQQDHLKSDLPALQVGDTIDVHVRIIEGAKERIQVFAGVIIAIRGSGLEETITVRRIVANEGVERIFPLHSPRIAKIEVRRQGHVRRAKLYYLRDRVGKKRRLADKRRGISKAGSSSQKKAPSVDETKPEADAPVQEEVGQKA